MLIVLVFWHILAYARPEEGEVVSPYGPYETTQEHGLEYTSTRSMDPSEDWRKGSRIKWDGNPLVHLKCAEGPDSPDIIIKVQDFSDKKKEVFECQDGTLMAEPLYTFMNRHLKSCLHTAMRAAGIKGQIKKTIIDSKGVQYVRKVEGSRNFSQHSTGRAIDIVDFKVTLEDNTQLTLPGSCIVNPPGELRTPGFKDKRSCERVGPMGQFYDAFARCWQDRVELEKGRCQGSLDPFCKDLRDSKNCGKADGALGCDDPGGDHKDHFHLSLPLCPPQKGIATI